MARMSRFGFLSVSLLFLSAVAVWITILIDYNFEEPMETHMLSDLKVLIISGIFAADLLILGIMTLYGVFFTKPRFPLLTGLSWFLFTDAILAVWYICGTELSTRYLAYNFTGIGYIEQSILLLCSLVIFGSGLVWGIIKFGQDQDREWAKKSIAKQLENIRAKERKKAEKQAAKSRSWDDYYDDEDEDDWDDDYFESDDSSYPSGGDPQEDDWDDEDDVVIPEMVKEPKKKGKKKAPKPLSPKPLRTRPVEKKETVEPDEETPAEEEAPEENPPEPVEANCPNCNGLVKIEGLELPVEVRCGKCDTIFDVE